MFDSMSSEDLRKLDATRIKNLTEQQGTLEKEIHEKQTELQKINDDIEALQVLLGESDDIKPKSENTVATEHLISSTTAPLEIIVQILKERKGADVHYTELTKEVLRRGGELKSSNPAALVNTLLTSDRRKRFVRPYRRGHYALKEDHPDLERSVGEKAPKKKQ